MSGLKGDAFFTHFARPDVLKVPRSYYEQAAARLAALPQPVFLPVMQKNIVGRT